MEKHNRPPLNPVRRKLQGLANQASQTSKHPRHEWKHAKKQKQKHSPPYSFNHQTITVFTPIQGKVFVLEIHLKNRLFPQKHFF